jgi:membrane dipeptidase
LGDQEEDLFWALRGGGGNFGVVVDMHVQPHYLSSMRSGMYIRRAKREGKIALVICLEGDAPLEPEISYLRNFYRLGLRCLGLTHDVRNEHGDGVRERSAGGLTHSGAKVVEECNRLGIVVDVSHLSDRGAQDVLAISAQPIIASHSNARSLCPHPRNLTDELLRAIAKAGGVIGFHAADAFISLKPNPTLDSLLRHIADIAEIGGGSASAPI